MKSFGMFAFSLATMCPVLAYANSAPTLIRGVEGSDVVIVQNENIRMVREVVDIECRWSYYTVQADFWFENTTSKPQDVQIGFPVDYDSVSSGQEEMVTAGDDSFGVEWNNRPIKFTVAKPQIRLSEHEFDPYRQWIWWKVRFGPNETAKNRVSYTFQTWNMDAGSKCDVSPFSYLKYIVRTGAAWNAPIESAVIRIHYGHEIPSFLRDCMPEDIGIPDPSTLSIYPLGYVLDTRNHTITWNYRNFTPTQDIYLGWNGVPAFATLDAESKPQLDEGVGGETGTISEPNP